MKYGEQKIDNNSLFAEMNEHGDINASVSKEKFLRDLKCTTALFNSLPEGSRIALIAENSYVWALTAISVLDSHCVLSPIGVDQTAETLRVILERLQPAVVVVSKSQKSKVDSATFGVVDCDVVDYISGNWLKEKINPVYKELPGLHPHTKLLMFSSGTSSMAKAIMLSRRNILSNALGLSRFLQYAPYVKTALPWSHIYGFAVALIIGVLQNSTQLTVINDGIDVMQKWNTDCYAMWSKLPRSLTITAPRIAEMMISGAPGLYPFAQKDTHRFLLGGALIPNTLLDTMMHFGFKAHSGYGLTEISPAVSVHTDKEITHGTIGFPLSTLDVRIGNEVDGIGEIQIIGDGVMLGYLNDEELTKKSFTNDGWFRTNDLGYFDKNGELYILGRYDDLIVLPTGKNINPNEIEPLFYKSLKHICSECAVAQYLNTSKLLLIAVSQKDNETLRAAVSEVNRHLPKYSQVSYVCATDTEMARGAKGQLIRNKLLDGIDLAKAIEI